MTGLTPPVTADRLITGISWWSSDSNGATWLHRKGAATKTKMIGMDVAASGCKGAAAPTVIRGKGQTVSFTLTAGVPLSRGHAVWWYAGATAGEVFKVAAGANNAAGTLTCGANTWDPVTYTVSSDFKFISVDLPNPTVAMNLGAYAAVCAAGDVVLTIRDWTDTQATGIVAANATANITAASCYACDSTGNTAGTCATTDAVNTGKGVNNYNSGTPVTFTMKQNAEQTTALYLEISTVRFEPLTVGAQGRFSFKPKLNNAFETYAAQSVFEYTFVSMAFATDSVCQVWDGDFSGAAHSTRVSSCDVNTAKVVVTLGEASENFVVSILGSTLWPAA